MNIVYIDVGLLAVVPESEFTVLLTRWKTEYPNASKIVFGTLRNYNDVTTKRLSYLKHHLGISIDLTPRLSQPTRHAGCLVLLTNLTYAVVKGEIKDSITIYSNFTGFEVLNAVCRAHNVRLAVHH